MGGSTKSAIFLSLLYCSRLVAAAIFRGPLTRGVALRAIFSSRTSQFLRLYSLIDGTTTIDGVCGLTRLI